MLHQKKTHFEELAKQKEKVDLLQRKTERYELTFRIFTPLFSEKNKLAKEIEEQIRLKENQLTIAKNTELQFESLKNKLASLQPQYEALDQSKIQENDLGLILQMMRVSGEIKTLKERTDNGSQKVKEVEDFLKEIQEKIEELSKKSELLKPEKMDPGLLVNVGNWFLEHKKIKENFNTQIKKADAKKLEIIAIYKQFELLNINPETFKDDFRIQAEHLENQKKLFSDKRNQLEVQQKLSHFVSELHDGEACPLCGALEHPNIVEYHDVTSELHEIQQQIDQLNRQKEHIQKQISEAERILDRKKIFEEQLKYEQDQAKQIQIQIENHLKNFIWKEFNPDLEADFEEKRQHSFTIEKKVEELNEQITLEQKNLDKERSNLDNYNKALEKFRLEEAKKEEQIKTNETNLKILEWKNYAEKAIEEVEEIFYKLSQSNRETEQNYQQLIKEEKEISPKLAEQKAIVNQLEKRISELEQEIAGNTLLIETALAEQQSDQNQVLEILNEKIDVQEAKNLIQEFRIQFETLKNSILELEQKLKDFTFDREEFSAVEVLFASLEAEVKTANDTVVKTNAEIERLEKEFKKKEDLLKLLSQLQKRAENLKIMTNLFKGAGFVQYVSSIYLRQLCDHANVRFHRMTRNQLSLQLNDNNEFEIIDYLNEGRSRSVKTLSGGQAFQVSLSLALALAESVQSNAKAEKNFFFIDEGFGTQDLESVNIVFETLVNLQKENRIVGIISHVEELKEKIPVSLNIIKDEEKGSQIEIV